MAAGYDVIIVGAGSAGCALAHRLSADPARRVCLIEAGGSDDREAIRVPHQYFSLWGTDVDWQYVSIPQPGTVGRTHAMPRGKVLGGTSSLNGMVYLRGAATDYDRWERLGAKGWNWATIRRSFEAMEEVLKPSTLSPHNAISEAMVEAAVQTGLPRNPDFDSGTLDGAGWNRSTIHQGERMNAHRAFVDPIRHRPNLTVLTDTHVTRVHLDGQRATGVVVRGSGGEELIPAGEVVLSAGAFDSPRLLMHSGIGPRQHLEDLGIPVVADLPVGDNLTDHLLIGIVYTSRLPISTLNAYATEGCAFARSSAEAEECDIEISFAKEPHFAPEANDGKTRYTIIPGITNPRSRGTVRLTAADPDAPLLIDPAYFRDPVDMEVMIKAVRLSRAIGAQAALDPWRVDEHFPGTATESDEAIAAYVAKDVSTWFHPMGTCKMGQGSDAVVGPDLRVRGIAGLRVADGSIMPDNVSVNTNAACMVIGWHAGEIIT